MFDITFNPGPSQISPETKQDLRDALQARVPEMSHRSAAFTGLSGLAVEGLRRFFAIPDKYAVLYAPSATDAMELIARNCVAASSFHFTCGGFGELFGEIAERNGKTATRDAAAWGTLNAFDTAAVPQTCELIAVTHCETSTGVMCRNTDISRLRRAYPEKLIAVDVTSIAGACALPIAEADLWFFSVQKGMGLPSGLGVLVLSPRAVERSARLAAEGRNRAGLFRFGEMAALMRAKRQTINTPNILAIHLLGKQLERWNAAGGIGPIEEATRAKAALLYGCIESRRSISCYVAEPGHRSLSVACLRAAPETIMRLHAKAGERGLVLGTGYGRLNGSVIRIANFPSLSTEDIRRAAAVIEECDERS